MNKIPTAWIFKIWSGILMAKWSYIMWCIIIYNIVIRKICTPCAILVEDTPVLFEISSKTVNMSCSEPSTFWKPSRMLLKASAFWLIRVFAVAFVVASFVVASLVVTSFVVASFVVAKVEVTSKSLPANEMSPGDNIQSSLLWIGASEQDPSPCSWNNF